MSDEENPNYALFRDCLSTTLLRPAGDTSGAKRRRRAKGASVEGSAPDPVSDRDRAARDAEEMADFIDYLASEIFDVLPEELKTLDYRSWRESEDLQARFAPPLTPDSLEDLRLPASVTETLVTYNLVDPSPSTRRSTLPSSPEALLAPVLAAYLAPLTEAPPATAATRADACELCGRSWIPLSYHHLIPRFVHDKAVRRGWHRREDLQNVAWLCGACHRFVHAWRSHEDLARSYYTVELLLEEDEVRRFAAWVGRLRWKGGRTRVGKV